MVVDPGDVRRRPRGDLVIMENAEFIQHFLDLRTDAANDCQVVRRVRDGLGERNRTLRGDFVSLSFLIGLAVFVIAFRVGVIV